MKIFDKRPLSLILCIILGGFVIFSFLSKEITQIIYGAALLFPFIPYVFKNIKKYRKWFLIITLCIITSFTASCIYFDNFFNISKHFDSEVTLDGEVIEAEQSVSYAVNVTLKTEFISDRKASYKLSLSLPIKDAEGICKGDRISLRGKIKDFSDKGGSDLIYYYYSDGISGYVDEITELKVNKSDGESLSLKLSNLRERLRRKSMLMSDEYAGNLLGALLTGERSELSGQTRLDFMRIGISHVLALSGMHLAILSLAVERLLKIFRVPKNIRGCVGILFCILYMFFVGFSVSVVRAGIMLIIRSLLSIFRICHDSVTSLFISVFFIIVFSPYAIFDVALWLSAFATLGIIIAQERESDTESKTLFGKIIKVIFDSVYASILANGATLALSVFNFGGISLLSPISTLIFSFFIEIYMYLGSIMMLFGLIYMPLSHPFGKLLIILSDIIEWLAALMSSSDIVYIIVNYTFILSLIIVFTVIFFTLIVSGLNKRITAIILTASFVTVLLCSFGFKLSEYASDELIYAKEDNSDMFIMKSGKASALICSSGYSRSRAFDCVELLGDNNISALDKYIVTHYSFQLEENIDTLLCRLPIKEISLPHPENQDEMLIYGKLSKLTSKYRTSLTLHKTGGNIKTGNFNYCPLYKTVYGEGSQISAGMIKYKEKSYLYLSSGMAENKAYSDLIPYMRDANALIFGSHGKKYKETLYINEAYSTAEVIILSSDKLFMTQFSYEIYKNRGCKIISHPQVYEIFKVKH